jgi:hypothetical protein
MPALVILLVLLICNWILFNFLFFIPFDLISKINSLGGSIFWFIVLAFLGWCLGNSDRS